MILTLFCTKSYSRSVTIFSVPTNNMENLFKRHGLGPTSRGFNLVGLVNKHLSRFCSKNGTLEMIKQSPLG